MTENNNVNVNDKDEQNNNVNHDDKSGDKFIPKSRFDEVNQKRKEAEETFKGVVSELIEDIPEDFRDLVPNVSASDQIKWIRGAIKKGLFTKPESNGPDSKRPGGNPPQDFSKMSPLEMISQGLTNKK